jgi:ribosomal protein L31E
MTNSKGKRGESGGSKRQITNEVVTDLRCRTFKKRALRAVKERKKFAEKKMKTPDVRIESELSKEI